MKQVIIMSVVAVAALNGASIDEAFKAGKISGQLRAAYVNQDNAVDTDTYTTSLGGIFKYETGDWNGLKVGIGSYISQKIGFATGDGDNANMDVLANNAKSYAYVGEAYIDYSGNDFSLRVGRQLIDTPLANTDDIRMHSNTYEAVMATYNGIDKTTLSGGYIKRWAGYDSGDDISEFKRLDGGNSHGSSLFGVTNESIENLALQGWYHQIDNMTNVFYGDATYSLAINEGMGVEFSGQYGRFNELYASNIDGNVYGTNVNLSIGMVTFGAAYNKATNDNGKAVSIGFGGGPYYTSMEEMTINGMEDARAYQLNASIDLADAGIEGATLSVRYGNFKSAPMDIKVRETDLVAAYDINEALCAEVSYAMIDDNNKNIANTLPDGSGIAYDGGYDRFLVRLSYNF